MNGDRWTPEMDDELRKKFQSGESAGHIGKSFKKTKNSVIGRLHRLGLYRDQSLTNTPSADEVRAWTPDEDAILRQMCGASRSMRDIATALSRSISACTKRARRIGISARPIHSTMFSALPWSDSEIAKAVDLRRSGYSWASISKEMHRHKAAIVSNVMAACGGVDPKPRARVRLSTPRTCKPDFGFRSNPLPPQIVYPIFPADLHCETVRNDERPTDGCRWLVNDCKPWLACAAKRMTGESYCKAHADRSFRPSYYGQQEQAA